MAGKRQEFRDSFRYRLRCDGLREARDDSSRCNKYRQGTSRQHPDQPTRPAMTSNRFTRWFSLLALLTSPLFAAEPRLLASGELSGRSGHEASGTVQLLQTEQGLVLQLAENFRFDGAPAPRLGFGRNGFQHNSRFAPLSRNSGLQQYAVSVAPLQYNEFWIWCDKFDVPIGYAKLQPVAP